MLASKNGNDLDQLIAFAQKVADVQVVKVKQSNGPILTSDYTTFPNMALKNGIIYCYRDAHLGDLAHECGHMALTPKALREYYSGFKCDYEYINDWIVAWDQFNPEKPIPPISDDCAATFWGYSALKELGLDSSLVFSSGFDSQELAEDEKLNLELGCKHKVPTKYSIAAFYSGMLRSPKDYTVVNWKFDSQF